MSQATIAKKKKYDRVLTEEESTDLLAGKQEEIKYQSVTGEEIREKDTERTNATGSQPVITPIEATLNEMVRALSDPNTSNEDKAFIKDHFSTHDDFYLREWPAVHSAFKQAADSFTREPEENEEQSATIDALRATTSNIVFDDMFKKYERFRDEDAVRQFLDRFDADGDGGISVKEIVDRLKNMNRELNAAEVILAVIMVKLRKKYITLEDVMKKSEALYAAFHKQDDDHWRRKQYKLEQYSSYLKVSWPKIRHSLNTNPETLFCDEFHAISKDGFYYVILIAFRFEATNAYGDGDIHCKVNVDGTIHNAFVATDAEGFDEIIVGMHRIFCCGPLPKTISLKVGEEEEIAIDYKQIPIDEWTKEENTCEDIKESKSYKTDTYQIYQEQVAIKGVWGSVLTEKQCNVYIDRGMTMAECVDVFSGSFSREDMKRTRRITPCNEYQYGYPLTNLRHTQFYYCQATKTVYGVKNSTIQKSNVYSRKEAKSQKTDEEVQIYQNITPPIRTGCRYHFIKECCLYGQDNEFNIFRSLCFVEPYRDDKKMERFAIGIICLMLQICLTIGIVTGVIENEEMLYNEDRDDIIVAISILSFAFISFSFFFTVRKFLHFYISMHEVCVVSWVIIFCDFFSNIVIGFIICACSLLFLLQSETVLDTVLNSFALIFVIELDDFINLFEADENVLIQNDWEHYESNVDWDLEKDKRKINILPHHSGSQKIWTYLTWMYLLLRIVLSPLYWLWAMIHFISGSVSFCKILKKEKEQNNI